MSSRAADPYYEYATVDTAPGAGGYFTNPVTVYKSSSRKVRFSIGDGAGVMTVTIQFKRPGDVNWTDYSTYTSAERKILEDDSRNVQWRAGVKQGDYTSGSFTFGFDW